MMSLVEAAWWVARAEFPDLDIEPYERRINALAAELAADLGGPSTLNRLAECLRQLLHVRHGFRGNAVDYHDPANSYLNLVIDRKCGIPITLSILYVEVARRAGATAEGVGFPGHYLVRLEAASERGLIDPFGGGVRIVDADLRSLLARGGAGPAEVTPAMLVPSRPAGVALRMLNNLKSNYLRREDLPRALRTMDRLIELTPHDPAEWRDRGLVREALELDSAALDDFEAFLAARPGSPEAATILARVAPLRRRLARWN